MRTPAGAPALTAAILAAAALAACSDGGDAQSAEREQLTVYGAMLGRMDACGLQGEMEQLEVEQWAQHTFGPNSDAMRTLDAVQRQHARLQSQLRSQSPSSCQQVERDARNTDWP